MLVTVKPPGREEFIIRADRVSFSSALDAFGYEAAQITADLDIEQTAQVLGGTLRIHGVEGIAWQGIVTRRPSRGEPLLAQGWGWAGTLNMRRRIYAKTDWPSELQEHRAVSTNGAAFTAHVDNAWVYIAQTPGTTTSAGDWMAYYYWGDHPLDRLVFTASLAHVKVNLRIYSSATEKAQTSLVYSKTNVGTVADQTAYLSGRYGFVIMCYVATGSTPTRQDTSMSVGNGILYGADFSPVNVTNIITDMLDDEIPTMFKPASSIYGRMIGSDSTVIEPLEFEPSTFNDKMAEILRHTDRHFGWYSTIADGQPACLPHLYEPETTPSLVVRADEAEVFDVDEAALDELASAIIVNHQTADGRSTYTEVVDTDTTHPLVELGITRYSEIYAQTTSATTAADMGALALAELGRAQVKGSVTTRKVYSATGADVYLPSIRPGQMVRLMSSSMPQGAVNCVVKRVECEGDGIVTLTLDNVGYRLDTALARLAKRK